MLTCTPSRNKAVGKWCPALMSTDPHRTVCPDSSMDIGETSALFALSPAETAKIWEWAVFCLSICADPAHCLLLKSRLLQTQRGLSPTSLIWFEWERWYFFFLPRKISWSFGPHVLSYLPHPTMDMNGHKWTNCNCPTFFSSSDILTSQCQTRPRTG